MNQSAEVIAAFRESFPLFFSEITAEKLLKAEQDRQRLKLNSMHLEGVPRRFAGNDSLARGAYYTVCNEKGHDNGTLQHELSAYLKEDAPPYRLIDLYIPQINSRLPKDIAGKNAIALVPIGSSHHSDWLLANAEFKEMHIDHTLDLRFPEALNWLNNALNDGLNGTYKRMYEKHLIGNSLNLIPLLIWPEIGGGDVDSKGAINRVIGTYLRSIGVSALIFPSARFNAFRAIRNGELFSWAGWNLVDYRTSPEPYPKKKVVAYNFIDWANTEPNLPYKCRIVFAPENTEYYGSFQISGPDDYLAAKLKTIYEKHTMLG